jgi:adenosylcobinamide-phosphate synthase
LLRLFRVENVHPVLAAKIFLRDRGKHASPNSGQTESVAAGMLGLRLGGDAVYEGKIEKKECMGDDLRKAERSDIGTIVKAMYISSLIFVVCVSLFFALVKNGRFCI